MGHFKNFCTAEPNFKILERVGVESFIISFAQLEMIPTNW